MCKYPAVEIKRKTGEEAFHVKQKPLSIKLLHFWQWAFSELVGNALRGILAEFLVATTVGVDKKVRTEWKAYDIKTSEGIKIEVKSGAYIQSWAQRDLSSIQFDIRPTHAWNEETNTYSPEKIRHSDVYIFCVLSHKDQDSIDPLDLAQWKFYIISTSKLDKAVGPQKTISLSHLLRLKPIEVEYEEIKAGIKQVVWGS